MKRKNNLPELLAPAGSFECLLAAVEAGADAVYVGGKKFGARAYAKNFDLDELSSAVRYCHLHGVKLYVTVNTLVLDLEMADVVEYAARLWEIGVDALIISDLGALAEIKKQVPDLELHASTQMSIHNTAGADAACGMGCVRAVLARELSLSDIRSVVENSRAEVEVFLHGALCVCHSGQCLFSSLVGGRSGNRGECAQPCRLPYNNGKYALSLKDLSSASLVRELVDSGVASLKIEGRMKSPSYVYTVTSIYRRLLDECRAADAEEREALRRAFSRGGFTDGYLRGKPQSVELGVRSEADKEDSRAEERAFSPIRKRAFAEVKMHLGEPSSMRLFSEDGKSVSVLGDAPVLAENSPLDSDSVKSRLAKMGNTYLSLDVSDISLSLDEGINLSPSAINALRRAAAEAYQDCSRPKISVNYTLPIVEKQHKSFSSAVFLGTVGDIPTSGELSGFDAVFASLMREEYPDFVNGIYLPPVIFDSEMQTVRDRLSSLDKTKIKYALVGNLGHISLARELGLSVICDFRLNTANRISHRVLLSMGVERVILSAEATLPQARDIGGGVIVYGRIPLMITERCFMKDNGGCASCSRVSLTDRKGEKFPMIREFEHRTLILNSQITYMGDKRAELDKCHISHRHFIFTTEKENDVSAALRAYKQGAPLSGGVRRVSQNNLSRKKTAKRK